MNPFTVLSIPAHANDETVRKAYLDLVRRFPPDTHPAEFKRINQAYETVKDEQARLRYILFNTDIPAPSPFQTVVAHYSSVSERKPLDPEQMKQFLRTCAKS